jgi:3-oxoadipate enol-lactonase
MTVQFQIINGVRIAYRFDGPAAAPVVVLSNSLMASMAMWQPQMEALADFRVLRMDNRGHGESDATPSPYSIAMLAADVVALLDSLGVAKAHFVGLSMGGMIGQYLGARHGERLLSLSLCDTASQMPGAAMWDQRIETARRDGLAALTEATLSRWFTAPFIAREPAVIDGVRQMMLATSVEGYAGCASAVRDMNQTGLLKEIAVPTTIIVGENDPSCPVEQSRLLNHHIAGSTLNILPDSAHLPNIEQADAFNRALLGHLHAQ